MSFTLTAWQPSGAYQWSADGHRWQSITASRLRALLEGSTAYPDDIRARLDAGETCALIRGHLHRGFARRQPTATEVDLARRQTSLF